MEIGRPGIKSPFSILQSPLSNHSFPTFAFNSSKKFSMTIGSRPADRPLDQTGSSGWTTQSGSLDSPLNQLYFGRAD